MESHGRIMVLWLANGQTRRGCRRLSAVLGGDREAQTWTTSHQHPLIRALCTTAPAHTSSLVSDHTRVPHAHERPLHPAALDFVPYGLVLVRVLIGHLELAGCDARGGFRGN